MAQKAGATTCSMIFEGVRQNVGWTESFQSNIASMDQAMTATQKVASKRVAFLSAQFKITYCRVSVVQAPKVPPARNQRVSFLQRADLGGSLDPTGDGDLAFTAALVRVYDADKLVFGLREFRGLPDNFWKDNDDKTAQATLVQPINAFIAELAANTFGINHKVPGGGVALKAIATGYYERLTHRITGRPLYLSRGRRSNRAG